MNNKMIRFKKIINININKINISCKINIIMMIVMKKMTK